MSKQEKILCECGAKNEVGARYCLVCGGILIMTGKPYSEEIAPIMQEEAKTTPIASPPETLSKPTPPIVPRERAKIPPIPSGWPTPPPVISGKTTKILPTVPSLIAMGGLPKIPPPVQGQQGGANSKYPTRAIVGIVLIVIVIIAASAGLFFYLQKIRPFAVATPTVVPIPLLPPGIGSVQFPNKQYAGVNDGSSFPFDTERKDPQNLRQQAMQALQTGDSGKAEAIWNQYLSEDFTEEPIINGKKVEKLVKENENDAEIQIYLQNLYIAHKKYFTLMIGIDSPIHAVDSLDAITSTRRALQGAYTAQKEFNDRAGDLKLRLLIVNTADNGAYVTPVAQQMASIISKSDKTVIGILGWQTSVRTESMLTALKKDGIIIPMVSQTASSDYLAEEHWDNLFQIAALNNAQAQAAVVQAKKLHVTKAIVFMDTEELYSQSLGQDFKQDFKQIFPNSPQPLEEDFQVENTNTAQFSQLLKEGLTKIGYNQGTQDTVIFFTGTTDRDVGRFQDALAGYPGLQAIAGDAGYVAHPSIKDRWHFVAYAYHDEWSTLMGKTNLFSTEYSDNFDSDKREEGAYGNGIADAVAIISYDAANILLRGIEIARSKGAANPTSKDLQAGLEAINSSNVWQGVSGQIAFDANHVAIDKALITLWVSPEGYIQMRCIQGNFAKTANYSKLAKC